MYSKKCIFLTYLISKILFKNGGNSKKNNLINVVLFAFVAIM